jgi:hypothetical protein
MAHRAQPAALFAGGKRDVSFGPAPWPQILVAIKTGRSDPVLQREVKTVLDAEPALFGSVDQKQSAERPERLAAEALLAFLIDHDDTLAGVGDFRRRDQTRQSAADHDYIRIIRHRLVPHLIEACGVHPGQGKPHL